MSFQARPPSRLPLWYFGAAHLGLATAFLFLGTHPRTFTGFFYHPAMMAPVHLVTLGWITCSILGALYLVAPMALRTRLAESRLDWWAFWSFAIGVAGMASHFWIDSYSGMVWSAALVLFALAVVAQRAVRALRGSPIPLGVKLHVGLAFVNVLLAGTLGSLLGLERQHAVLPGYVLDNVFAHAHLAALGWATMMVFGVGYRLFPMLLAAGPPPPQATVVSALLLEGGVLALFHSLLRGGVGVAVAAALVLAAIALFFALLVYMLRHRRRPARDLPRPDVGLLHVAEALLYLLATVVVGAVLVLAPMDEVERLRLVPVYAICGLLGFLAQMVLGVSHRILPLYAWFRAASRPDRGESPPPPPYAGVRTGRQLLAFWLWSLGVPLLALGFYLERALLIAVAAWILLAALLLVARGAWQAAAHLLES